MTTTIEIVVSVFLIIGGIFAFIGSLGLAKLNDFYMRLHGPTKASTLGLGGVLLASTVYFTATKPVWSLHELLITVFLFITAPVSAHLLAKTALHKGFEYVGGQPNPLEHESNLRTEQIHDLSGQDEIELTEEWEDSEFESDIEV